MANPVIFQIGKLKLLDYFTYEIIAEPAVTHEAAFNFTGELAEQMTGPSLFPVETEVNRITTEASLTLGDYNGELTKALMGTAVEENVVDDGLIKDIKNTKGLVYAPTSAPISALALNADKALVKSGLFLLRIVDASAGTAQVISLNSPDLRNDDFSDVKQRIVKEVTLAAGSIDLGIGVTATVPASPSFTAAPDGSVMVFRVLAQGARSETVKIGQNNLVIPKVKLSILARTMSDGRWFEFFAYNAIFPGLNYNFNEEFSKTQIAGKMIYDVAADLVAETTYFQKR